MRVLSGRYKGRTITVPVAIRPTSLRLRKACFDMLAGTIEAKRVLDLFAGSGSLGIEAMSLGAQKVVFIDSRKSCVQAITKNIQSLNKDCQTYVFLKDAFLALKELHQRKLQFDIIFLDPPYYQGMLIKALQALEEYDILARFGYVVGFCYSKDRYFKSGNFYSLIRERKYGQATIVIYRKEEDCR